MIAALESGNHRVVHITEHERFLHNNNRFGNSTPDVEYLGVLSRENIGWVVISGDSRILDTAHERAALIASGLTFFALDERWSTAGVYEQAWKFVKLWSEILACAAVHPPALYRVSVGRRPAIQVVRKRGRR